MRNLRRQSWPQNACERRQRPQLVTVVERARCLAARFATVIGAHRRRRRRRIV